MSFQFCDGAVSDVLLKTMPNLSSLDGEQLMRFCKIVLGFLSAPQQTELASELDAFAESYGINAKALNGLLRACIIFFSGALQRNLNPAALTDDLNKFGVDSEKATIVAQAYRSMFGALTTCMVKQTLSVAQLVDLEWKFGVTASSSELDQVGQTFLMLKLVLTNAAKPGGAEAVTMELTLSQFYQLLQELEKAKALLEQFS